MSARTIRTGLLAATAILATLSLTACTGDDTQDEGASSTSGNSGENEGATTGGDQGGDQDPEQDGEQDGDSATDSEGATGSTGSTEETDSTGSQDSGSDVDTDSSRNDPCTGSNTETTATEVSRPLNHLLITVTNTGSENCDLLDYPILRFEDAQSVPPVFDDSKPQAVVTLAPGESGYAGVLLASADGSGSHHYTAESLEVMFHNGDGESATPPLPEGGVSYDDTLTVTYWQRDMDDALYW